MDDVVNRFAKELADAIAAAVAENPQVEACRDKAREAGFEMRVTLEAVVGFVNRSSGGAVTKITTPARLLPGRRAFDLTANDRRFLRSLRIGADEAKGAGRSVEFRRPATWPFPWLATDALGLLYRVGIAQVELPQRLEARSFSS